MPARASSASSSKLRAGALRALRQPRAPRRDRRPCRSSRSGLPGATSSPCSRRAKAITHRIVQSRAHARPPRHWRVSSSPSSRCRWIAAAITSPRASRRRPASLPSGRLREAASRSRAAPIPAADRGCRRRSAAPARARAPAGATRPAASQRSSAAFGNSQRAGHLGAGHGAVRHQLVELALATAADSRRPRRSSAGPAYAPICMNHASVTKIDHIRTHMQDVCANGDRRCRKTSPPCNWCSAAIRRCSPSSGCRCSSACRRWCSRR